MNKSAPHNHDIGQEESVDRIGQYLLQKIVDSLPANESAAAKARLLEGTGSADIVSRNTVSLSRNDLQAAHAFRLSQAYSQAQGGTDEHPIYTDEEWQIAGGESDNTLAYWCWVADNIESDGAMWPWDREAEPAVLICRAAHINIEYLLGKGWVAKGLGAPLIEHKASPSEFHSWQAAAHAILELPAVRSPHLHQNAESLSVTLVTYLISARLGSALQELLNTQDPMIGQEGSMRVFQRTNNFWVRLANAAGVEVKPCLTGLWAIAKGPAIQELTRITPLKSEESAWWEAAQGLICHLRQRLNIPEDNWLKKSPSQQLELITTFFVDSRVSNPNEAFEQHQAYCSEMLCRSVGWKVTCGEAAVDPKAEVWSLNLGSSYGSEREAWQAGANEIRKQVMQHTRHTYLEWAELQLDDQILLAQEHLL
jgi:hypothetical protein